jgi:hypothetical protein
MTVDVKVEVDGLTSEVGVALKHNVPTQAHNAPLSPRADSH